MFIIQGLLFLSVTGSFPVSSLKWRHNEHDGVSNHQPHNCLLNCLFRRRSRKTSKLRVTGFCEGNSPVTCEFPTQRASNVENVSIWWRLHYVSCFCGMMQLTHTQIVFFDLQVGVVFCWTQDIYNKIDYTLFTNILHKWINRLNLLKGNLWILDFCSKLCRLVAVKIQIIMMFCIYLWLSWYLLLMSASRDRSYYFPTKTEAFSGM